jgi:hypothetical protein
MSGLKLSWGIISTSRIFRLPLNKAYYKYYPDPILFNNI